MASSTFESELGDCGKEKAMENKRPSKEHSYWDLGAGHVSIQGTLGCKHPVYSIEGRIMDAPE